MQNTQEAEVQKIDTEINELFPKLIQVASGYSFASIKAAMMLSRDHIVRLEAEKAKESEQTNAE